VEVTQGQWEPDPKQPTLVAKAFIQPGLSLSKAKKVWQLAVIDTFGESPPAPRYLDWYDPDEEKTSGRVVVASERFLFAIFFPGFSTKGQTPTVDPQAKAYILTRSRGSIARALAENLRARHLEFVER
jgi:hypothetical protein